VWGLEEEGERQDWVILSVLLDFLFVDEGDRRGGLVSHNSRVLWNFFFFLWERLGRRRNRRGRGRRRGRS